MTSSTAIRVLLPILAVALAATLVPAASAGALEIEPDHSGVDFLLDTTFHEVHGTMKVREGSIVFDPESGQIAGQVVVDARSAESGHRKRDKKMHNVVLESEKYPDIVFRPRRFQGDLEPGGESHVRILGSMEIHGSTHEVAMPAVVRVDGDMLTGSATLTVPFVEWGMKDPSVMMFRCKKTVALSLRFEGQVTIASADARSSRSTDTPGVSGTH